jgi:hypothetical protein
MSEAPLGVLRTLFTRFTPVFLLLPILCAVGFGQASDGPLAAATVQSASQIMAARLPVDGTHVVDMPPSSVVFDSNSGAPLSATSFMSLNPKHNSLTSNTGALNIVDAQPNVSTIDQLNTVATFDGAFVAQAGPDTARDFRFTMVGNDPRRGGTTVFPGLITEVSWQLLNADGSVFTTVSFAPFENLFLNSPNFVPLNYRSGNAIEYQDAVHRAQFFSIMKNNWHSVIAPQVVDKITITVPFFVNVQLSNGTIVQARSYFTGTAADGSTFVLMLSPLFNFFFDNAVVNEINLGNFQTNAMNMSLFPNTFLFNLNVNNPNVPGGCCVLGFHTFFLDGGFPEHRWITQFASWISPGIFGAGFQDVTALSHELAESFGNPFISNPAPNWQFPGEPPTAAVCQNNLEEGDPIEVLPNATTSITVTEKGFQFTYHPQNIPLLQWFEMGTSSSAIDGAFSFPDETVLPHSALPCPNGKG